MLKLMTAAVVVLFVGCHAKPTPPAADAPRGTVTMQFRLGEETKSITIEQVADGESLESLMRNLSDVEVSMRGSGTTAFVDSIDGTETDASAGWTFKVDGEWSDKGVGATVLHPPTTVTWEFGSWQGEPQ
jgi:hypothetical protein